MSENTSTPIDLTRLQEKFPATDVEWRISRSGDKNGKVWAMVVPYLTSRAIMTRLDEVCGAGNWRNEFKEWQGSGVLCGISIRVNGEWVTKWDGAGNTDVESIKGGLSDSMKRAGFQWGIGRYLYDIPECWAVISERGQHSGSYKDQSNKQQWFKWDPPQLPDWASPGQSQTTVKANGARATVATESPAPASAAKPKAPKVPGTCSPAQFNLITKLADQHGLNLENDVFPKYGVAKGKLPTSTQASDIIDRLKNNPPSPQPSGKEIAQAEGAGMRDS